MRHLIIDGYNVLRTAARYKRLAQHDLESARTRLIADASMMSDEGTRVTVVFDAGRNEISNGVARTVAGVDVVFSRTGSTADDTIEALAACARSAGQHVVVVTSDAATQHTVMGGTVVRMSAREFAEEVEREQRDRSDSSGAAQTSVPVERRIDAEVRRVLDRWIGRER
ncbi:NYN domain-containing protein [Coriobacteriia bacterium Es71-Z0120]|jgi:predicted RNA-binding protein with PIN domain|uniref:NYN domain-containing protein n=1 Tax=Parvivirga hydrogeniphila TaxID=2939460 RepID=UPI002260FA79|nr:NYN domain-containing protein [Parvivirga hydrogeniphila]MCL4078514.1 NYN domain-containing protein [Parvivirga hydrogeniphila]